MLTVRQYAESRNLSESTVKGYIRRLDLDLPTNPNDKRQRLISGQNQAILDETIGCSSSQPVQAEVVPYERSESIGMVLAESALTVGQYAMTYQNPDENPFYQALQHQVRALEIQNAQSIQALQHQGAAFRDVNAAIDAVEQMQIAQAARDRAFRHHNLEQQIYHQSLTEMRMASQGLSTPPAGEIDHRRTPANTGEHESPSNPAPTANSDWL
jgi:hypothetical protein